MEIIIFDVEGNPKYKYTNVLKINFFEQFFYLTHSDGICTHYPYDRYDFAGMYAKKSHKQFNGPINPPRNRIDEIKKKLKEKK